MDIMLAVRLNIEAYNQGFEDGFESKDELGKLTDEAINKLSDDDNFPDIEFLFKRLD